MTKRIRAIGLDAFDTALEQAVPITSPYRTLIEMIFPHVSPKTVKTVLRHAILTSPMGLEDVPRIAADLGIFATNTTDMTKAMTSARHLLDQQLADGTFKRNPDVDAVKVIAQQHHLQMGIISDLAQPYGVIVKKHLGDIRPHYLSYETYTVKNEGTPFHTFAKDLDVAPREIAYVGNHLEDDYLEAYDKGLQAFWYVPDRNAPHMEKHAAAMALYDDDIVASLPEIFVKLKKRGFTL